MALDFVPSRMRTVSYVLPLRYLATVVQDVKARRLCRGPGIPPGLG